MINHTHTQKAEINFAKLLDRIIAINNSQTGPHKDIRAMINNLVKQNTLIVATGGSKVVAYYLKLILEKFNSNTIEVIEPRDYFYKTNTSSFSNLVAISSSGTTNGIQEILKDFSGKKYLICEEKKQANYQIINWGSPLYDKEKSFISIASSLGPMALFLSSTLSLNKDFSLNKINAKIKQLIAKSSNKINKISFNFQKTPIIQIISGYDTKCASTVLESNLIEAGIVPTIVHDKGSFCHGRSNLLFQYPNSLVIYLTHKLNTLDNLIIKLISQEYSNILVLTTEDLPDDIIWQEYYLTIQMYFLAKKIAKDKNFDLTQPEYNPNLINNLYYYKGEM